VRAAVKWVALLSLTYFAGTEGFALFAAYLVVVLSIVRLVRQLTRRRLASA